MAEHYVSMDMIRAAKKRESDQSRSQPSVDEVYADPDSVVSSDEENAAEDTPSCSGTSMSGHSVHSSGASGEAEQPYEIYMPATRKIVLHPGPAGLGMSIAGGVKSPFGLLPVFITDIDQGGLVDESLVFKVGDRIVSVNGEVMEGKTHRDVVLAIKAANDHLVLEVTEGPENIMKYVSME